MDTSMDVTVGKDPSASVLESVNKLNEKFNPNDRQQAMLQSIPNLDTMARTELDHQRTIRNAEVERRDSFLFKLRSHLVSAYEPNRLEASVKKLKFSEEMDGLDKIMEEIGGDELELWRLVRSSEEGEQNRTWENADLQMERADFTCSMVFLACRWAVDLRRVALLGGRDINLDFAKDLLYQTQILAIDPLCNEWIAALYRQNAIDLFSYVWNKMEDQREASEQGTA